MDSVIGLPLRNSQGFRRSRSSRHYSSARNWLWTGGGKGGGGSQSLSLKNAIQCDEYLSPVWPAEAVVCQSTGYGFSQQYHLSSGSIRMDINGSFCCCYCCQLPRRRHLSEQNPSSSIIPNFPETRVSVDNQGFKMECLSWHLLHKTSTKIYLYIQCLTLRTKWIVLFTFISAQSTGVDRCWTEQNSTEPIQTTAPSRWVVPFILAYQLVQHVVSNAFPFKGL